MVLMALKSLAKRIAYHLFTVTLTALLFMKACAPLVRYQTFVRHFAGDLLMCRPICQPLTDGDKRRPRAAKKHLRKWELPI